MADTVLKSWASIPLPESRRHVRVADQLVQTLQARGIDKVFGIPGGAISPVFDALIGTDIEVVVCQHEGMAMYMAYGYSRGTGRPAAVMVTSGPGVLNTVTAAAAAKLDEVPVVIIAGEVRSNLAGMGMLQDGGPGGLDVASVMRPVTKRVEAAARPGRILGAVHQAVDTAMAHPRGPVLVTVPIDLATAEVPQGSIVSEITTVGAAPEEVCRSVAQGLETAMRPVIVLGLGARLSGVGREVYRLAERARCPVITDIEAKGLFPESHALSLGLFGVGGLGIADGYLAQGIDFMLTVGARLDDTTTAGFSRLMRPAGHVIQLDHNPDRLRRSMDYDVGVVCDLAVTMRRIQAITRPPSPQLVLSRDAGVRGAMANAPLPMQQSLANAPHHPAAVIKALQAAMPDDTIYTSDIGNHLVFAAQNLVLERPDCFHIANGLGGMGSGVGTAMGLALRHGKARAVVGICGDGSLRMVGNELSTCAANGIPVVLAVLNDGQLGMVEHGIKQLFGRTAFCESPRVDVVAYARSLGAEAVRIERARDLARAVKRVGSAPLVLEFPIRSEVVPSNPRVEVFDTSRNEG